LLVLDLHLIGADVLGDAAGLPGADLRLADRIQQAGLAVVDVAHDGDDGRTRQAVLVALLGELGIEVDVELLQQLALLVLRGDDLDLVAQLLAQQAERVLVQRLGRGGHLTHREHDRDQRGGVDVDAIGEVGQRGAATQTDRLPVAARDRDAARRGGLLLLELLPLRALRLARPRGLAAATERALGAAASATTTGTAAGAAGAAGAPRAAAAATAASALVGLGETAAGVLAHDAGGRHPGATAGTRGAVTGRTAARLVTAGGAGGTLPRAGHALRAGEGVVAGAGTARTGTSLAALGATAALARPAGTGAGHALRAGEGIVAGASCSRAGRGALTAGLRRDRLLGARLGDRRLLGARLRHGRLLAARLRRGHRLLGLRLGRGGRGLGGGGRLRGGVARLLRRGLHTGLGGAGRLGGRCRAALLRGGVIAAPDGQLLAQTAGDRRFDGRGGGTDEFAHVLQLLQDDLARVSEL